MKDDLWWLAFYIKFPINNIFSRWTKIIFSNILRNTFEQSELNISFLILSRTDCQSKRIPISSSRYFSVKVCPYHLVEFTLSFFSLSFHTYLSFEFMPFLGLVRSNSWIKMARCSSHAKRLRGINSLDSYVSNVFFSLYLCRSLIRTESSVVWSTDCIREKYVQKTSWLDAIDLVQVTLAFQHSTSFLFPSGTRGWYIARVKCIARND